jgi:hypothetical protein
MQESERDVVTGLVVLMLILWGGFLLHRSPEFAGSFTGFILGSMAALLMFIPLVYMIIKRIRSLKKRVTQTVRMRTLLAWHIYAGVLGPVLALLHTGHRFESPLGIGLTVLMLITVLSGFIGRYLMSQFSSEIREKQKMLANLKADYHRVADSLCQHAKQPLVDFTIRRPLLAPVFLLSKSSEQRAGRARSGMLLQIVDAMSDLEYSIKIHETFKRWFGRWLKLHIVISLTLYVLLIFHIGSEIYFGLRWL